MSSVSSFPTVSRIPVEHKTRQDLGIEERRFGGHIKTVLGDVPHFIYRRGREEECQIAGGVPHGIDGPPMVLREGDLIVPYPQYSADDPAVNDIHLQSFQAVVEVRGIVHGERGSLHGRVQMLPVVCREEGEGRAWRRGHGRQGAFERVIACEGPSLDGHA